MSYFEQTPLSDNVTLNSVESERGSPGRVLRPPQVQDYYRILTGSFSLTNRTTTTPSRTRIRPLWHLWRRCIKRIISGIFLNVLIYNRVGLCDYK